MNYFAPCELFVQIIDTTMSPVVLPLTIPNSMNDLVTATFATLVKTAAWPLSLDHHDEKVAPGSPGSPHRMLQQSSMSSSTGGSTVGSTSSISSTGSVPQVHTATSVTSTTQTTQTQLYNSQSYSGLLMSDYVGFSFHLMRGFHLASAAFFVFNAFLAPNAWFDTLAVCGIVSAIS